LSYIGKTIALNAESGRGKTTQAGELAKYVFKKRGKKTVLNSSDRGGYLSLAPLVRAGVVIPNDYTPDLDPWMYVDDAANGRNVTEEIGLAIFDSGTSMGEELLRACRHSVEQIGQRPNQKFKVTKGADNKSLVVPTNTDAHYGIVQSYMLEAIRKSTWLTRRGVDVIWTFTVDRSENENRTPVLGFKLVGHALSAELPKEFNYTFYLDVVTNEGSSPEHVLYTTIQPGLGGLGHSFGNARLPLGISVDPVIRPASLLKVFESIDNQQEEADRQLAEELGL
jgi:hypothetical protein